MITSDTRYTREFKPGIAMARAVFNRQTVCISRLKLDIRKELIKRCFWNLVRPVLIVGHLETSLTNNWKVLKCGAAQE